jgi:hypothetical protein
MTEPRLASDFLVGALRRQAELHGAYATVLRKGDATSGSILLVMREKGANPTLFERFPSLSGNPVWTEIESQSTDKEEFISSYLARRSARDPDLWILELDVPFVERFTAILQAIA